MVSYENDGHENENKKEVGEGERHTVGGSVQCSCHMWSSA